MAEADFIPSTKHTELLLGCGHQRKKELHINNDPDWQNLVTLDFNEAVNPDVVHDLEDIPLPFADHSIDEIHAYEVLEHVGAQGDWRFFFEQFNDFHRILKPGGHFYASVPMWNSAWAWSDPGHKRVISQKSLIFLSQENYTDQPDNSPLQDYRNVYTADFHVEGIQETEHRFYFVLKAL